MKLLKEHGVVPFDLVVVNLYPFEEAFLKGTRGEDLIEQIDIGGPSLLRAAAKSYERVTVVCDPADYSEISERTRNSTLDEAFRHELAVKVFEHTSMYDSIVSHALRTKSWRDSKTFTIPLRKKANLRYGENPHQKAVWYENPFPHPLALSKAQQLQGKELSFNNILDLDAAVGVVADFDEPAVSVIKHLSPCGVAVDTTIEAAYKRAFEADSVSAFGGIIAMNRPLSAAVAEMAIGPFLECLIAPSVDESALKILAAKKNLRVLTLAALAKVYVPHPEEMEIKGLRGNAVAQTVDRRPEWNDEWKVIGEKPDTEMKQNLIFAQRVVRHVKSNAIVIAENGQTLGICGGQTNRVDSVKMALERARGRGRELVLASDAFFPFRDSIDLAAKAGVRWIIQPGGSLRDAEVEAAARENKINMIITGTRHFKH
jgi:phosphoribosylaminoimidazolecarboxamide formyltransferase / IMP cyclohydrolase